MPGGGGRDVAATGKAEVHSPIHPAAGRWDGAPIRAGMRSRHSWAVNSRSHGHPSPARPSSSGRPRGRAAGIMAGLSALLLGTSRTVKSWGSLSCAPHPAGPIPLQMCPFPVTQRVAICNMQLAWQQDGTRHRGEERGVWPSPWDQATAALANGTWQLVPRLLHSRVASGLLL